MGDEGPKTKPRSGGNTSPWMPRLRKRGEKLLHSKYTVILVIVLTVIDCSLVIAELILDLYSVKKTLISTENQTLKFIRSIRTKYPDDVRSNESVASIYERLAYATIVWNNSNLDYNLTRDHCTKLFATGTVGMPHTSTPSFHFSGNNKQPEWSTYQQSMQTEHKNSSKVNSNHRFRRSGNDDSNFKYRNLVQDNERTIKISLDSLLNRVVDDVKSNFLNTGIRNANITHFLNSNTTFGSIEGGRAFVDDVDNTNDDNNNDSTRHIHDLFYRKLSQFITMQINESQQKDFDYGNNNNFNDNNINSDYVVDNGDEQVDSNVLDDSVTNIDFGYESWYYDSDPEIGEGGYQKNGRGRGENSPSSRRKRSGGDDSEEANMRRELHHSTEMEIAHKLHYASVCVASILVIEVSMKIVCAGSHFLKRKIEVFDAVVIVTSVVVDLIFIKGLSEFAVDDSIFVLAFLLPWRVIRVVNSLVMAVIDHEQVKLRLLYSRKKKLDKTVESLRNEVDELKGMLQDIRSFCIKEGIESSRIDSMLGKFAPRRRKDSKFYTLVKLVMSTASINNNDNDSVSSSSIENDLRHISNKDSIMNLAASSRGTMTSLKQYLSVPYSDGDSNSISDVDSIAGDYSALSPSIYITSPVSDDGRGLSFCDIAMEDNDVNMASLEVPGHNEDNVATIAVTSSTTNINTMNGVAFYVGSETSLNIDHSQDDVATVANDVSHTDSGRRSNFSFVIDQVASRDAIDANKNIPTHHFGQFLTVPNCTDGVATGTNAPSLNYSCNNNNNGNNDVEFTPINTSDTLLPQGLCKNAMKRSASDNMNINMGFSPYEGPFSHASFGSPTPSRRLQEVRTKRKIYSRSRSESEEKDFSGLKKEGKGRSRRNSGDPQSIHRSRNQDPQRARSHSPSPMTFLSVPGSNKVSTYSASQSMTDVRTAGDPYENSSGKDEIILRRSCLNLNSDGRKRRDKSPHRVSFKVS